MDTEKAVFTIKVQIPNGPGLEIAHDIPVHAYGKFSAVVTAGATDTPVSLPWGADAAARFLVIKPAKAAATLSYKANDSASTEVFVLDGPHVLCGSGAVKMLAEQPLKLFFSNSGPADMAVEILIGG